MAEPQDQNPEPPKRAEPDYEMMDDTGEWAQSHYLDTHGRRFGDEPRKTNP